MNADGPVWLAYYQDWSGFAVFSTELLALRYAVEKTMAVTELPFGVDPRDWLEAGRR